MDGGGLGDIYMAKGLCLKPRGSIGRVMDSDIPEGVNWDAFLGPAPYRPFNENRFHYKWHWFWDTGNGDFGNQGIHQADIGRWVLNKASHPVKIQASATSLSGTAIRKLLTSSTSSLNMRMAGSYNSK